MARATLSRKQLDFIPCLTKKVWRRIKIYSKELEKFDIRGVEQGTNLPRQSSDIEQDQLLLPITFDAFKGQPAVVRKPSRLCAMAKMKGEALDHVLLHNSLNLGKRPLTNHS